MVLQLRFPKYGFPPFALLLARRRIGNIQVAVDTSGAIQVELKEAFAYGE